METSFRNPFIGHPAQLMRINDYRIIGGLADGVRCTDIHNGRMTLSVCADKGMDFPFFHYKGVNIGYLTPGGIVGPSYFDDRGNGFLRGFFAGFLTTCGLTSMGAACDADGEHFGLHGRVNNLPAEEYACTYVEEPDRSRAIASGRMRQAVLFGENLTMQRKLIMDCGEKSFQFTDTIANRSHQKQRHMILYHFNIGYPMLDENTEVLIPHSHVEARDACAEKDLAKSLKISKPTHKQKEMCYFYKLCKDANGQTFAGIYNHRLQLGVLIYFDGRQLDHFTQWKMMGEGEYALGLEPGNATVMGVQEENRLGHIKYLDPWETRSYHFIVQVIEGIDDYCRAKTAVAQLISS